MLNKRSIGFFAGIAAAIIIMLLPLERSGLGAAGQRCLALTLMTIVWWALDVAQSGFVGGAYLAALLIFGVAEPSLVFKAWYGSSTMWLVVGAYMIAGAVKDSGLGERIAYTLIRRLVKGYNSVIVTVFLLTFVLSLLIPHPWPRAFLIMSVMAVVIKSAGIPREDAVKIGFAVFAAEVPISLIFLTGDSVINPLAAAYVSDMEMGWIEWFVCMGVPSIVASIITMVMLLILFRPKSELRIDTAVAAEKQAALGKLTALEKRTLFWVSAAILLWLTEGLHGINVGWITFGIAVVMGMPCVGEVLKAKSWSSVPANVLVFLTAAMAIGAVGNATGMNAWIAEVLIPDSLSANIWLLALIIAVISMVIHMFMGSVIAVMGVVIPALLAVTEPMGISSMAVSLIVYMAIASHYVLPFHHLDILVGVGEENGMFTEKETVRFGLSFIIPVFALVIIQVLWWNILKLI